MLKRNAISLNIISRSLIKSVALKKENAIQYVAQFSYGPSFRTKRTLFDYFRRSFKSSSIEEFQK